MSNVEKVKEMLKNDPTLTDQLKAEAQRLAEAGNKDVRDISVKSIKAVFGMDLTDEELMQVMTDNRELSPDELEKASGGDLAQVFEDIGVGIVGGAAGGAMFGMFGGPIGLAIGAGIGAVALGATTTVTAIMDEIDRRKKGN